MDYRNRRYFLVYFNSWYRSLRMDNLKRVAPTIKMHPPYNHLPDSGHYGYDGSRNDITGMHLADMMISCSKDESEAVLYELNSMVRKDLRSKFFELTKSVCKQ